MRIRREIDRKGGIISYEEFDDDAPDVILATYQEQEREQPPPDPLTVLVDLFESKGVLTEEEAANVKVPTDVKVSPDIKVATDSSPRRVAGLVGMARSAPTPTRATPISTPTPHIDASTHGRFTRTDVFFAIILIITLLTTLLLVAFL